MKNNRNKIVKAKASKGSHHQYLGRTLDINIAGTLMVDRRDYFDEIIKELCYPLNRYAQMTWTE